MARCWDCYLATRPLKAATCVDCGRSNSDKPRCVPCARLHSYGTPADRKARRAAWWHKWYAANRDHLLTYQRNVVRITGGDTINLNTTPELREVVLLIKDARRAIKSVSQGRNP